MIQIEDLEISYGGNHLFSGASFILQKGEKAGLVGRNGSGKSTLLRLITGQEVPDAGIISIGKNYRIGMLDQHIKFQKKTIIEEAALGLQPGEADLLYKAETILFGLGFSNDDLDKEISSFSGGYQLRLHLAKLLIAEPDCLLLDEPTNYLDIVSIRWLTRFLKQWKGEFILISHDREFMDSVTTHTIGIHRNKIKKVKGDTVAFYGQILVEEEIHEKTRQNQEKKRATAQGFIDRFGAKASKAAQAQSRQKMLDRIPILEKMNELNHLAFQFQEAPFFGKKMLEAEHVDFSYTSQPMITNLSLTIEKGDRVAIVGKNGRGKSTVLRLLAKNLSPQQGNVKHSENLSIGFFGQTNIERLHPEHTIEEEIRLSNSALTTQEIRNICGLMMFSGDLATKFTAMLSGGEKSRVLLGKILAKPCNLLLLDEPTHHLDMESIEALMDALEEFTGAVILVTHSELLLKRIPFDKIVICRENNQEMFLGNYERFLEKDGWHDAKQLNEPKVKKNQPPPIKQTPPQDQKAKKQAEKAIAQKEQLIEQLEQEIVQMNEQLLKQIEENNLKEIQQLSIQVGAQQAKIDQLYEELSGLY